jgi:ATP-binding cassette subfamily B protein
MGMGMGMHGWHRGLRRSFDDIQQKPHVTKTMLLRILRYFKPHWKLMVLVFLCVGATSVLGLLPPLFTGAIVDRALIERNFRLLTLYTLGYVGVSFLVSLIGVGESYLNTLISKKIILDIRNAMYGILQRMPLKFFSNTRTGDIISRINNDVSGVEGVFQRTIVNTVQDVLVIAFTLVTIFAMDWRLSILGLCLIPSFILPTRRVGKARWNIAKATQERLAELNQIIQETLGVAGAVLVKIFTREDDQRDKFDASSQEVVRLQIREALVGRWFFMFVRTFSSIGPALIYFYGGYLVIRGELTVGTVIAFNTLLMRLFGPVTSLFNMHVDVTRSLALFERVFEYLDLEPEVMEAPGALPLEKLEGRIEYENVCFSYKEGQPVLKDVSFTVEPGEMVALVGPSGAGKTTVTYLVPRLYDPDSGIIRIDGIDVRQISLKSLRSQIGIVTQDTFLFNASIRENVLFGRIDATEEEMIEACKAAYIHDFITSLEEGYDTLVGERGIKLSGGEKQRIAIARAILRNPRIIILDEATSSLDSHAETLIKAAIAPLLANRTSLVIAHRLSTVLAADKILVIEDGRIVESGTHQGLLASGGLYRRLYDEQFGPETNGSVGITADEP